MNYIPPKPKVVDKVLKSFKNKIKKNYEKRDSLFQPTQTKSALTNFAVQYRIKGSNGYDPESFLLNSKQPITNLMINTPQTKVKLIPLCMMEKVDLKSGEVIAKESSMCYLLVSLTFRFPSFWQQRKRSSILKNCYLCIHQKMVMLDMCVLDGLILSKPRNR